MESLLDSGLMSSVNLSEVLQKAEQHGVNTEGLEYDLEALGIEFRDFDVRTARPAAESWSKGSGLSLGDRACLALAASERFPAVTADGQMVEAEAARSTSASFARPAASHPKNHVRDARH